ncbi:MAG TPA: NfeD family protein [Opitutaceae bacterium]|jgi:membrane-bound ClpP family serine protease
MTLLILLFVAGILLLAADIFAASFVMAVIGGTAMLAGCIVAYRDFGPLVSGLAGLGSVALVGIVIYWELVLLPKSRLGRGLVVESTSGTSSQPPVASGTTVVGRPATADTTLAPSGYVLVDGTRYEAFCRNGHANRGEALRVVGIDNFRLIVSKT